MEAFVYTPGGHETIDSFNMRLAKYAVDNNVTGVVSTLVDSTLVLSLALDADVPSMILLRPFVAIITEHSIPTLEKELSSVLEQIKAQDSDDSMSLPVELRCMTAAHPATKQRGYALFLVAVGDVIEDDAIQGAPNGG